MLSIEGAGGGGGEVSVVKVRIFRASLFLYFMIGSFYGLGATAGGVNSCPR